MTIFDGPFTFLEEVEIRREDGYRKFMARFEVAGSDRLNEIYARHGKPDPDRPFGAPGDAEILRAVWVGWEQVGDDKVPPYTAALRDQLIDNDLVRGAVVRAYFRGLASEPRRKN